MPGPVTSAARREDRRPMPPRAGTAAGDAVPRLFDLYGPRLYALASRLCRNAADAEDLVQDVFLQAHRKWPTFAGRSSAGTWLHAIAARSCRSRTRRRGGIDRRMPALSQLMPWDERSRVMMDRATKDDEQGDPHPGPIREAIKREAAQAVHAAILSLPERFRLALVLKDILELPIEDAAAALDINPVTVRTRVHRARLLLRKAIMRTRGVPTRAAPPPAYDQRVCFDLLKAKLDALDKGRSFPIGEDVLCERCRSVFAELDLAQQVCASMGSAPMPGPVRARILKAIADADRRGPGAPRRPAVTPAAHPAHASRSPRTSRRPAR